MAQSNGASAGDEPTARDAWLAAYLEDRLGSRLLFVSTLSDGAVADPSVYTKPTLPDAEIDRCRVKLQDAVGDMADHFDKLYTYQTPLGQREAFVLSFSNAYLFVFSMKETEPVVVAVERAASDDFSAFVTKCIDVLHTTPG